MLKDLQKQVSMQDWEDLYESHQEQQERRQMEIDMFGEELNDDALADELDALVAEDAAGEMVGPATGVITGAEAQAYRDEHGIAAPAQQEPAQPAAQAAP